MQGPALSRLPRVAVTMGDPCGIGPELIIKVLSSLSLQNFCRPVVIGDLGALRRASKLLGLEPRLKVVQDASDLEEDWDPCSTPVVVTGDLNDTDLRYGNPSPSTCKAVIGYIEEAVRLALSQHVDALCTGPINKANLHSQGFPFPGHTEFLRELTGAPSVAMMLAGPRLRVSLATIHHALAAVPANLTQESIRETIVLTGEALYRDFGLHRVHVAVAGLNPHAGEGGRFGLEDEQIIRPAIESLKGRYPFGLSGPFPPDTVFRRAFEGEFDAVVAMYHDQGLIPVKLVHFHDAVNVTLGLPIIRTAVDHGTAYDLAGTGQAHPGSLFAATRLAAEMVRNRGSSRL